jgi:hypothetical protein
LKGPAIIAGRRARIAAGRDQRQEFVAARRNLSASMATATTTTDAEQLERVLLRRGVGVLAADRNRCVDCERTPLVGEQVHLYGHHGDVVCELCRPLRRAAPAATETVRHTERGHTVRLTARAA